MDHTSKGCESIQLVAAKGGLLNKKAKGLHLSHYLLLKYLCLEYFVLFKWLRACVPSEPTRGPGVLGTQ